MNSLVVQIARQLREYFLESFLKRNDVSIFLCGGASTSDADFRRNLGTAIAKIKSKYRYSVFYPEDMFVELILGHQRQDLLTLENLLAESVSAVVILLQSPGTFTELGAFSNHLQLKDKLVVIMEPRYQKKSTSFITTGPIRYLQKKTSSRVLYHRMIASNIDSLAKKVAVASREVGASHPPTVNLTNPIACYEFYLALIYTFDPIPRSAILSLAKYLEPGLVSEALTSAETVLNGLVNQRDALLVSGSLQVSQKGIETLFSGSRTEKRQAALQTKLSDLRINALNVMLRKKQKGVWGEAA
jgi:hypothetical protein